jgi:crossover junction endodeoxyribonuclease RuvC
MRILAVDQSFTSCGLLVFEDEKVIYAERYVSDDALEKFDRAWAVSQRVRGVANLYEVEAVVMEGLAFSKFGDATRDLAGLQYIIATQVKFEEKLPLYVIPPNSVKKRATGKGNSKKEELYDVLPSEPKKIFDEMGLKKTTGRYDLTDAYWIGISGREFIIQIREIAEEQKLVRTLMNQRDLSSKLPEEKKFKGEKIVQYTDAKYS